MPKVLHLRAVLVLILGLVLDPVHLRAQSNPALQVALDLSKVRVPAGFRISIFTEKLDVPEARFMAFSPAGTLFVTSTNPGQVLALPDRNHTGRAERVVVFARGLRQPHGLAFVGNDSTWLKTSVSLFIET